MFMPTTRGYFDVFDDFFNDPFFKLERKESKFGEVMKTDIKEKGDNYIMDIDIPGADKENINIELNDGYLTVSSNQKNEIDDSNEEEGYIHKERFYGSMSRSYYVGKNVKEEDVKASFKNGTLTLTFPKEKKQIEEKKFITIE